MKKQAIALLGVITATALLAGCHHGENKLLKEPKKDVVKFLSDAQVYASEKTKVLSSNINTYIVCVNNPEKLNNPITGEKNHCDKFFKAMLQYSKRSKVFNDIDMSDLNNKAVAKRMGTAIDDYQLSLQ